MRSLYLEPNLLSDQGAECRVLSVSLLLRELIRAFTTFPVEYDEAGSEGRLVGVLLDQLAIAPHMELSLPLPADARLRRLCGYLQETPDDQRTLAEWALLLGASEKTLSRHFQRETGLTFRAWRQKLRLLSALTLLERGESVTTVALSCGYDSPSAFIAAFRTQFGTTPGDFFSP
jgi:AraC-like DNA-binding protein